MSEEVEKLDAELSRLDQHLEDLQWMYGLRAGHVVTLEDVERLGRVDEWFREEEETSTDIYHRGYNDALRSIDPRLVDAKARHDETFVAKAVDGALQRLRRNQQ